MKGRYVSSFSRVMKTCLVPGILCVLFLYNLNSVVAHTMRSEPGMVPVCADAKPGEVRCQAVIVNKAGVIPSAAPGYSPSDLRSAYNLPSSAGGGQTVAVIDVYDDPKAEADMAQYRSRFGIPACTTGNGCFRKVDQNGGQQYPPGNASWSEEISLDLDMVSAICPNCRILLVEASSPSVGNVGIAVNTAARLGATVISNSYGTAEYSGEQQDENAYFRHPGISIVASAGDGGYGALFPASSQYVTAVGGTSLYRASNGRGWNETVWGGTGSGCSVYIPQPSWQPHKKGCVNRMVADVSAVADPSTGVIAYDSYGSAGGWVVFGGTSVATPIIAGTFALAGGGGDGAAPLYAHPGSFHDITNGSNGGCGTYLCTAGPGYDGPSGLGSPNGIGGF